MPLTPELTPLDEHPLNPAAELMAARHRITAEEARRRLERIAASLGISNTLLAGLIVLGESHDRC
jgi:hypothetical protein